MATTTTTTSINLVDSLTHLDTVIADDTDPFITCDPNIIVLVALVMKIIKQEHPELRNVDLITMRHIQVVFSNALNWTPRRDAAKMQIHFQIVYQMLLPGIGKGINNGMYLHVFPKLFKLWTRFLDAREARSKREFNTKIAELRAKQTARVDVH